jgi:glucose/arabinose dehydrogenase
LASPASDASDATAAEAATTDASDATTADDSDATAADDSNATEAGPYTEADGPSGWVVHPCTLPGSAVRSETGLTTVAGGHLPDGGPLPDVSYVTVPPGFCVHYFGNVGNARQIRFAWGGEAFVASPTTSTTSGGQNGQSAIMVLPDDDDDGVADQNITFLGGLASTQGLLFARGYFYYQDAATIRRVAYASGQRAPSGPTELVVDIAGLGIHQDGLHWPKTFDISDDGTIYVGNGGSQDDVCVAPPWPFLGGILKLEGDGGASIVARGFRNPIAIRCSRGFDLCFALELAKDYSYPPADFGREKFMAIRQGDDWGYPCCATQNVPYAGLTADCSGIVPVSDSFLIGDTPFGLDFEPGRWSGMWNGRAFIAAHGAAGTWKGARLVGITMDPTTGLPLPGTNYMGGPDTGAMADFATGWDDGLNDHGRPTAVSFSPDGRLFLTNDTTGDIVWIAPTTL